MFRKLIFLLTVIALLGSALWVWTRPASEPGIAQAATNISYPALTAKYRIELSTDNGLTFRPRGEGTLYRDAVGRVRDERTDFLKRGAEQTILIKDAPSGVAPTYVLDVATRSAKRIVPPDSTKSQQTPKNRWVVRAIGELGTRNIEGFDCKGLHYGPGPITTHSEVWLCEQIELHAIQILYLNSGSVERTTFYQIRLETPGPSLFVVPAGYAIQDIACASCPPRVVAKSAGSKPMAVSTK